MNKIIGGIYEPEKGIAFYTSVKDLKSELEKTGSAYAHLRFNEILVTVSKDSNPDDIATIYDLKNKLRRMGVN